MQNQPNMSQEFTAELVGTFILVFAGCGAIMVNALSGGAVTHVGVAVTFGAVIAAMIYCFGHVSGCHINPAVTLAFWVGGAFPTRKVPVYLAAQVIGAIGAAAVLKWALGDVAKIGTTLPLNDNWQQSFILEIILTFILMLVICGSGLDARAPKGFAGLAIGLTVGLDAMCMGPITGASMNPARSFGPVLISGNWQHHWLYWVAPIVGALLAVAIYRVIAPPAFRRSSN
jgi:aquaporin Z